jgi:tetratricopeptide (TPR) repeat protein
MDNLGCNCGSVRGRGRRQQKLGFNQPIYAQEHLKKEVVDARDLQANGNSQQADQVISDALAKAKNGNDKYELYLQQGANFENQQKYPDALNSYKSALAIKQTYTVYVNLGRVSAALGDKQAAINYYRSAGPLIDNSTPTASSDKRDLQARIKELGE